MIGIYAKIIINNKEEITIDKSNIISASMSTFVHEQSQIASYGIISSGGNISFKDNITKDVLRYANEGLLVDGLGCTIKMYDSLSTTEIVASDLKTTQWDYDSYTNEVSVSLKDDLDEWQNIQVKGFGYDPQKKYAVLPNGTMADLYGWLQSQDENGNYRTPLEYKMLPFDELDEKTKNVLSNTIINYPLLKDGSLWQQWTKVCQVCALHIYKNNEGKTICSYTYGS